MTKATVAAVVRPNESHPGTVLLTRRNVPPFMGQWCLPGGHIDDYETAEAAVTREVLEETGLQFTSPAFLHYFNEVFPKYGFHAVVLAFHGTGTGTLQLMPEEVKEISWVPLHEALELPLAFNHQHILRHYAKHFHL
ncbi:MAG: NUDIX hydrolase [Chlorobiaceae bacterium]|nr:NUDIX hydrolase [Chlorobiaceae bacterium]